MEQTYVAPKLERLGTFRDLTGAGGCIAAADATNPWHRYDFSNQSCPMS